MDASGAALRLKHHPALATISAAVDLQRRRLVVTATGQAEPLEVALPEAPPLLQQPSSASDGSSSSGASACQQQREADACGAGAASTSAGAGVFSVRACARTALARSAASVAGGSAEVAAWFTRVLGLPCRLVQQAQQQPARQDASGGGRRSSGSFANEAQLLVVGAASLADLAARSASADTPDLFAQRFRCVGGRRGAHSLEPCTSAPCRAPAAAVASAVGWVLAALLALL